MARKDHEQLDIHEMERLVGEALLGLVDDPQQPPITLKALVTRSGLPKHRVREVVEEWQLRTLSGDEYMMTPALVERVRSLVNQG